MLDISLLQKRYIAAEPIYIRQTHYRQLKETDAKLYCNSHCNCRGSC